MASLASERATVQAPLIEYARQVGWAYLSPEEALSLRGGETGTLLTPVLREKLLALNPGVVTPESADRIVGQLESVRAGIEGNAEVLTWLRGERSIEVEAERRRRNVNLIAFDHPGENTFQVTDEWQYTNGRKTNRADIIFLINGIPVALVETKSAAKKDGLDIAHGQVRRYHEETPELLAAPQVFDLTHLLDFFYGATWNLERQAIFNWKDEEPGNFERKVKRFFARERFLKLLRHWIVFYKKDDDLRKIILRQHQTRAAEKVVERALDPAKRTGLVWHTQGAGKTFTMIKAADLILHDPALTGATVIMLVDRNELESQLFQNLRAYGMEPVVAQSKRELRELLRADRRGLIVSTIHKFDGADAGLCTRENVFLLVDEAHRTTSGDLGNYLVGALPNATMIGFTGTPIDKIAYGRGTFKVFGKDDARGYMDKYSIAESIADGATLPLRYSLAPNELRVPEEQLEKEFLGLAEAQGISDVEELNRVLDRAINLKAFLKAHDRVEKIAAFVAQHFRENVEPLGYKAFLVSVDREACALYKDALDRHLPPEHSAVVYTSQHNDPELLRRFALGEEEEKRLRRAFTKPDQLPKIVIVTEKLLTGFDAPLLYCMYLDKPMRDHTLLQAIARVNRPYEDERGVKKPSGYVLDFVGIFEKLERALAFDSDLVGSAIEDIALLRQRFAALMRETAPQYLALCVGPVNDTAVERAVGAFADKKSREEFFEFFAELEGLYEILSPDAFLRPYLDDYERLAVLHQIVANAYGRRVALIKDLMRKTEALVRSHAQSGGIAPVMAPIQFDEETLRALKARQGGDDPATVMNLGKSLLAAAEAAGDRQPHLLSIAQRAEGILDAYDDRQVSTGAALDQLTVLVEEYLRAQEEAKGLGLDASTFAIYWLLQGEGIENAAPLAGALEAAFRAHPHFRDNPEEQRSLRTALYKALLPAAAPDVATCLVSRLTESHRL